MQQNTKLTQPSRHPPKPKCEKFWTLPGVTASLISQLQTAASAFASIDLAPRTGIVQRSTLLRDLNAAVASLMENLADLDDLIIHYDTTEAGRNFIAAWKQARIIVDAGHGPAPQTPPAGPPTV